MVFLDTNILLYSVSTLPEESRKRAIAAETIDGTDCVLSVQVLQEFYHQATRPTRPNRLPPDVAAELVEVWMRFPVQDNTASMLVAGMELCRRYKLSLWDALIIAAAQEA